MLYTSVAAWCPQEHPELTWRQKMLLEFRAERKVQPFSLETHMTHTRMPSDCSDICTRPVVQRHFTVLSWPTDTLYTNPLQCRSVPCRPRCALWPHA